MSLFPFPTESVSCQWRHLRVRSFGIILKRITDPRLLGSQCIKGTDESTLGKDFSVYLIHHDSSDRGSVNIFRIIPKERTWPSHGKFSNSSWNCALISITNMFKLIPFVFLKEGLFLASFLNGILNRRIQLHEHFYAIRSAASLY